MLKDFLLNNLKNGYIKTWTREELETMAQSYFDKGIFTQDELDNLQEFFEPTTESVLK